MASAASDNPQKQRQLEALAAAEAAGKALFAVRRPGWQPAPLELAELQLDAFAPLEACGRQACPSW